MANKKRLCRGLSGRFSWKYLLGYLFFSLLVASTYVMIKNLCFAKYTPDLPYVPEVKIDNIHLRFANLSVEKLTSFSNGIVKVAQYIALAKKHVRGTKTSKALIAAQKFMIDNLDILDINYAHLVRRRAKPPENVCPEVYKGRNFGYPHFETGFVAEDCEYGKNLEELITIVFVYEDSQTYDVVKLLNSVRDYHSKIPIIIGSTSSEPLQKIPSTFRNIKIISKSKYSIGDIWNKLVNNVLTKYTFIARDVIWFNNDIKLDRLIRTIERLDLSAAGGAFRDIKGNWFKGCQQRVLKNSTLVYEAGYDESFDECLFCDHIDGPFVIKTGDIQNTGFKGNIQSHGLYEDLFLRLDTKESVVCPDIMFYTNRTERSYNPHDWASFMNTWPVYKIKFSGREIIMPTPNWYICENGRDRALTPWCQQENMDLTYAAMSVCADLKLICELDSGTMLGSIKFHSVLPWERDADLLFLTSNFTALVSAKQTWAQMGYRMSPKKGKGGYIALRSKNWRLEFWGMPSATSDPKAMHYQPPTLLPVDVKRVRGPRNPGLWARNRYGPGVYQHAQHFEDLGDLDYKVKTYLHCTRPGSQDCLDQYNVDGNIQFKDPIP